MGPTPLSFGPRGRFFVLLCFVFQGVEANSKAELAVKGVETFESPVLTFLLRTHALDLGQVAAVMLALVSPAPFIGTTSIPDDQCWDKD
ncbi:hypothetical protein PAL_GLEAN10014237 [Pteropus alecto]|uniref:Uncharacterized protein n=1 Tax=Pteropus alecto TaxID=9402 RepID=L5K3E8_PTEAL|nr:hypothetical protein PAL_GLEAN10014237 [Pteropus alecto]